MYRREVIIAFPKKVVSQIKKTILLVQSDVQGVCAGKRLSDAERKGKCSEETSPFGL
jgi:hypothetical protein